MSFEEDEHEDPFDVLGNGRGREATTRAPSLSCGKHASAAKKEKKKFKKESFERLERQEVHALDLEDGQGASSDAVAMRRRPRACQCQPSVVIASAALVLAFIAFPDSAAMIVASHDGDTICAEVQACDF